MTGRFPIRSYPDGLLGNSHFTDPVIGQIGGRRRLSADEFLATLDPPIVVAAGRYLKSLSRVGIFDENLNEAHCRAKPL